VESIEDTMGWLIGEMGFGPNGYLQFLLDNTGTIDIDGLAIWINGNKGTSLFDLDDIVFRRATLYDKKDKQVTYDFAKFGNIKKVQFIPKIMNQGNSEICPRKSIKAEIIGVCT